MGAFVTGDVGVMPFPFSDLSTNKRRPTLVLAELPGDDLIVCQITGDHRRKRRWFSKSFGIWIAISKGRSGS
jgi:hypothetical protein